MRKKTSSRKSLRRKADKLWSDLVKQRAGFKCELCGRSGVKLESHHIISRREYTTRWTLSNGLCVCHACHLKAHQNPLWLGEQAEKLRGKEKMEALLTATYYLAKKVDYENVIEALKQGIDFVVIQGDVIPITFDSLEEWAEKVLRGGK